MEENTGRKKSGFAAGLLTGIVIMLMISILGFGGWYIVNRNSSGSYTSENVTEGDVSKKLDKLNKLIDKYYLYQDEVDQDALVEGIYSGYAAALGDPYTVYYNKDETKALMESTSGTFSGVGATLTRDADTKAVTIVNVYQDSPAEKAGLKANDVIKAVDGTAMENSSNVTEAITSSGGNKVVFTVARDGKNVDVTVEPKMVEVESYDTGFVVYGDRVKTSPIGTLKYSVEEVGYSVKTVIQSLGMLFTGKIGFNSLLGPVGTVSTMSEIVEESKADGAFYVFLNLMNLAALISANLGVMNLLPIPALDGGRLVFLIIEALRGKPVKREHEGIVNFVGMILLVILMIVVLLKDIMALF